MRSGPLFKRGSLSLLQEDSDRDRIEAEQRVQWTWEFLNPCEVCSARRSGSGFGQGNNVPVGLRVSL